MRDRLRGTAMAMVLLPAVYACTETIIQPERQTSIRLEAGSGQTVLNHTATRIAFNTVSFSTDSNVFSPPDGPISTVDEITIKQPGEYTLHGWLSLECGSTCQSSDRYRHIDIRGTPAGGVEKIWVQQTFWPVENGPTRLSASTNIIVTSGQTPYTVYMITFQASGGSIGVLEAALGAVKETF